MVQEDGEKSGAQPNLFGFIFSNQAPKQNGYFLIGSIVSTVDWENKQERMDVDLPRESDVDVASHKRKND